MIMRKLVEELMTDQNTSSCPTISQEQYLEWARGFVFEGLRNQRYGQSFCNFFGIKDNILFYSSTVEEADRYIKEHYVR